MASSRYRVLIRTLTVLLLIWVAFDIGAHGFLASDFGPLASGSCGARLSSDADPSPVHSAHDHCFCHAISVGAVLPALVVELAPSGTVVRPLSTQAPRSDGSPLDHPPQLAA